MASRHVCMLGSRENAPLITNHARVVPPPRHGVGRFARWVAEACPPGSRVLNIGAGRNRSGALRPLHKRSPYVVGIDPHPSIHANERLAEAHLASLEEFADDHAEEFDVAFAIYVLEHVEDPEAFMTACARVLRPGGSLFALTVNMHQYFGLVTWAATRMGVSDWLLERVKGRDTMENYHFPTQYRLNSLRTLRRHLDAAGFSSVDFRCYDDTKRYQWYLPPRAHWLASAYTKTAYAIGSPRLMGHLSFRAVK